MRNLAREGLVVVEVDERTGRKEGETVDRLRVWRTERRRMVERIDIWDQLVKCGKK